MFLQQWVLLISLLIFSLSLFDCQEYLIREDDSPRMKRSKLHRITLKHSENPLDSLNPENLEDSSSVNNKESVDDIESLKQNFKREDESPRVKQSKLHRIKLKHSENPLDFLNHEIPEDSSSVNNIASVDEPESLKQEFDSMMEDKSPRMKQSKLHRIKLKHSENPLDSLNPESLKDSSSVNNIASVDEPESLKQESDSVNRFKESSESKKSELRGKISSSVHNTPTMSEIQRLKQQLIDCMNHVEESSRSEKSEIRSTYFQDLILGFKRIVIEGYYQPFRLILKCVNEVISNNG